MGNRRLTQDELAQFADAALVNARDLIEDARVLLAARHWPRAYALAVLATEEYGKFFFCVTALPGGPDDPEALDEYWRKFWKKIAAHGPKLTAYSGMRVDAMDWGPLGSDGDSEWLRAWKERSRVAERDQKDKLAALYVDFTAGQVSIPAACITEHQARVTVEQVTAMVNSTPFAARDIVAHYDHHPQQYRALMDAMRNNDRDAAAAALLELIARV